MSNQLPLSRLALWFVISRLALLAIAGLSLWLVPHGPFPAKSDFLDWLNHWDARWYMMIAQDGYSYDPTAQSSVNFFPLYPVLVRIASLGFLDLRAAGYLVSNGLLFGSCVLLWKLTVRDYRNPVVADRAVLLLLAGPMTVFFSSLYAESLLIFLLLLACYFSGSRRWLAAGLCGFLAALTRAPGVLVVVPIAVEFAMLLWGARSATSTAPRVTAGEAARAVTALALPELGLGVYMLFLDRKFGEPLAFVQSQAHWGRHLAPVWNVFSAAAGFRYHIIWFYGALLIALALVVVGVIYRMRPAHLAMTFALIFLYCSSNTLEAIPRYLSVVFPLYIAAGLLCGRYPRLIYWLVPISILLAAFALIQFVCGYWIT